MYNTPKSIEQMQSVLMALKQNGIDAVVVKDGSEAKNEVLKMIPDGAQVMTMTSVTLETLGISESINNSEKYNSVRAKLSTLDSSHAQEKRALGAVPDYTVGSVHAVTEDGKIIIASNTGSQLPAYAYGAGKVIWVVGTQKVVKNLDEGMKRIYEYTLPLESKRAHSAYGVDASFVSKILIINQEITPGRITIVFIPENLGY